jgi:hypothetical protein
MTEERTFAFRPGWIIVDCSKASGGIHYDREPIGREKAINKGNGVQLDHKTRKTVDHVEVCAAVDACVKKVDYSLRKHCVRTDMGWFADDMALQRVKKEVNEIAEEADDLNTRAEKAKSKRRAKIRISPLRLDATQPETVAEIADTIRGVLGEIRDALRGGDIASLHKLKIRSMNLERLATGFQSDAIRFALDRVPTAANEIRDLVKVSTRGVKTNPKATDESVEKAINEARKRAGAQLDLSIIEAAITHFEPAVFEKKRAI